MDAEAIMLVAAEAALEAGRLEESARLFDELHAYQGAHPVPELGPRRQRKAQVTVGWLASQVELELARPSYRRLSRFQGAAQGARRLRAVEAEERAYGRPGYALRTGLVAAALEEEARHVPAPLAPLVRVRAQDTGHGLPRNWKEHARLVPVAQVFGSIGVVRRQRRWAPCPACRKPKPHVEVYADNNTWKCFRCQEGGSALDAVSWALLGHKPTSAEDWEQIGHWFAREAL